MKFSILICFGKSKTERIPVSLHWQSMKWNKLSIIFYLHFNLRNLIQCFRFKVNVFWNFSVISYLQTGDWRHRICSSFFYFHVKLNHGNDTIHRYTADKKIKFRHVTQFIHQKRNERIVCTVQDTVVLRSTMRRWKCVCLIADFLQ